jgi:hypothetical protein
MLIKIHKNHIFLFLNLSKILGCYNYDFSGIKQENAGKGYLP